MTGSLRSEWEGRPVEAWRVAWGLPEVEIHDALPSTMGRCWARAEEGAEAGTLVLAEEQTAGRGRSGGRWYSPAGQGLWMSLLLEPRAAALPVLPLRIGLRLARGIEATAPVSVALKWPNDLWLEGRKVGGILAEARGGRVVVGMGLNVRTPAGGFPAELEGRAVALDEVAGAVGRGRWATAILEALVELVADAGGPERLTPEEHQALSRRDLLRGRRIRTSLGEGEGAGIRRDGALLLRGGGGGVRGVVAGRVEILEIVR